MNGKEVKAGMEYIRVQLGGLPERTDQFVHLLNEQITRYLHKDIAVDMYRWTVDQLVEVTVCSEDGHAIRDVVAQATAEYILDILEKEIVRDLIVREYGFEEPEELAAIESYCWHSSDPLQDPLQNMEIGTRHRKSRIYEELIQYFDQEHLLNIDGMVRFRLQRYTDELRDIIEYAIDEYTADKQYEEFVSLLKYFVYIQEAKIPAAHLIHRGGHEFILLNEQMEPIETKQLDQFVVEMIDKEINYEDMIVSTLITVSPQKVYIHTRNPEMQVIKTIQQIFEERASVCTSCPRCRPLLGEYKRQDHYFR